MVDSEEAGGLVAVAGNEDNDRLGGVAHNDAGGVATPTPTEPRPGPDVIEADTWGEPATASTVYSGRHHTKASRSKLRVAIGAGVAGLTAAVVIPLALSGSPTTSPTAGPTVPAPPLPSGGSSPTANAPTTVAISATPSPTIAPTTRPAVATVKTTPPATPKPIPVPFAALTLEAEAGGGAVTLGGSAWITSYDGASNGKIARNVGDWDMRDGPGTVRFNEVKIPTAGRYVLAISFVHPDNESTRTARIDVAGLEPVTVTFNGGSECCEVKEVDLDLPAGTHTIKISNEKDRAPSIDKVVIRKG